MNSVADHVNSKWINKETNKQLPRRAEYVRESLLYTSHHSNFVTFSLKLDPRQLGIRSLPGSTLCHWWVTVEWCAPQFQYSAGRSLSWSFRTSFEDQSRRSSGGGCNIMMRMAGRLVLVAAFNVLLCAGFLMSCVLADLQQVRPCLIAWVKL